MNVMIGLICTILGVLFTALAYNRNREKDVRHDAEDSAVIRTKLDNIHSGIDIIRIDIKANEKRMNEINERVIRVEESSKQAHKRIDSLETKGGNGE